jgi:uncharacterized protein (TIGR02246 family)
MTAQDEVAAINERFAQAVASEDMEALMDIYADDVQFLVPDHPLMQGRDAAKPFFEEIMRDGPVTFRWQTEKVYESGNLVIEVAREWFQRPGETTEDPWKYVAIYRRENGELKQFVAAAMPEVDRAR